MYIENYSFSTGQRKSQNSALHDRFKTVSAANGANYDDLLHHFSGINLTDAYVIENKPLDNTQALEVAHAMLINKPIIALGAPTFEITTLPFLKEVIESRLSKILVCDITMLDDEDLRNFLSATTQQPMNYSVTKHETTLIKAFRRQLFRNLLAQTV